MNSQGMAVTAGAARPIFMEHRWGQRLPCRARVHISDGFGIGGEGRIRDISSSGAFIETPANLSPNVRITLFVRGNESADRTVEIDAVVMRAERDGIGVEWCETPAGPICAKVGCTSRCAMAQERNNDKGNMP